MSGPTRSASFLFVLLMCILDIYSHNCGVSNALKSRSVAQVSQFLRVGHVNFRLGAFTVVGAQFYLAYPYI